MQTIKQMLKTRLKIYIGGKSIQEDVEYLLKKWLKEKIEVARDHYDNTVIDAYQKLLDELK